MPIYRGVAQLASVLAWGASGRPFESDHPDLNFKLKGQYFLSSFILMFYTYILYSESLQKFYTGHTENLDRRLKEHNRGKTPFMAKGIPWKVVFSKTLNTRVDAMKFEKMIKKRGAFRFLNDHEILFG
jgi:putative endonuclease